MQIIVTKAKSELSVTHTNIRILVYYILYIAYMLYSIVVYCNSVCIQIAAEPIR